MKRIAFLISAQHLIPHGGIGQFAKGFAEMCQRLGFFVDIVLDDYPKNYNSLVDHLRGMGNVSICYPLSGKWDGKKQQQVHAFSESINFERVVKFRDSLMGAMQTNLYDAFIINTPEALFSTYALGLHEYVQHIFYTHNENLVFKDNKFKGVFNDVYDPMIDAMMRLDGIVIGTQTLRNVGEIGSPAAAFLPMPIPERGLLKSSKSVDKNGVLFIGRWEERKNPKEFIRVIKETGLPAKVMTNSTGAPKFKAAFEEIGAQFEIKESIVGQEKVDFIRSAKVFFMPSKSESYGFALMEALCHCHTVVLDDTDWWSNFDATLLTIASKKTVSGKILDLYKKPSNDDGLEYVKNLDLACDSVWEDKISSYSSRQSKSQSATILSRDNVFYKDYIETLGRFASVEDIISVLGNKHKFNVLYDKADTYLTTKGKKIPERKTTKAGLDDLF